MKPRVKTLLSYFFGPSMAAHHKIVRQARPLVERLEDRLVPTGLNLAPQTFIVTTALDNNVAHPGKVSLRDAIDAANADHNLLVTDTIQFDASLAGATIKLNAGLGELQIFESVNIQGLGAKSLTIDGGAVNGVGGVRLFELFGGEGSPNRVTLSGLTLQNSNYQAPSLNEIDGGGAIGTRFFGHNVPGGGVEDSLTVQNCVLTNNTTNAVGGAIAVTGGNLIIQDSVLSNNKAGGEGGAILFDDSGRNVGLQVERSTVANNTALGEQGGGLCIQGGHSLINSCTFNGNVSGAEGGAIANRPTGGEQIFVTIHPANTVIQNTTIYKNTAKRDGAGLWSSRGTLTLLNDTVVQNNSLNGHGGGIFSTSSATTSIFNTIVAANTDSTGGNDLGSSKSAAFNAQYSLIQVEGSPTIYATNIGNIFGESADLGAFQYNGGPVSVATLKPHSTSKALRKGSIFLSNGLGVDERGRPRTYNNTVDIGAVEASLDSRRSF